MFFGTFLKTSYSSQEKMNRTCLPFSRSARATSSTEMISLKFPICTVPEGVTPEAQVYSSFSPFSLMILSALISAQCTDFGLLFSLIVPDYTQL